MRTIEAVRLANFLRLVADMKEEVGRAPTAKEMEAAFGISHVYAWQLCSGKRKTIDSKAARIIERKAEKDVGWLDTDFELWPFPDADLLAAVGRLDRDQSIEVQGAIREAVARFGTPRPTPSPQTADSAEAIVAAGQRLTGEQSATTGKKRRH